MDATTAVPLVTPDAHWSPASALLEVPCLPSHPNARGPCQARAVRNPRCTRPAWAPCGIALRSSRSTGPEWGRTCRNQDTTCKAPSHQ